MRERFAVLAETLKAECGAGPVYYLPNPGNWGDGLIRHGTLRFFHDIRLDYRELTRNGSNWPSSSQSGRTAVYGGGGAWCRLWDHSHHVAMLKGRFSRVIVLPSTFELSYTIPGTIFFCRDLFESKRAMPDATFCHDMAFCIGRQFARNARGNGDGYFFRRDSESSRRFKMPSCNNDISLKGHYLKDVAPFFAEIDRFATIYTDRLHVAIAGCLLEKTVHFYAGSYFKNRAVYLSSMKDYFADVHFHEEHDAG